MKPRIGVISRLAWGEKKYAIGQSDLKSVIAAGGVPVVIPIVDNDLIDDFIATVDGIFSPGGMDINTLLFNEEPVPGMGKCRMGDDLFEMEIIRRAHKAGKPVLGICRGEQVINVAFGGTLYQDIPSQTENVIRHYQQADSSEYTHTAFIKKDSLLYSLCGTDSVPVNSYHHQSVKALGEGLKAAATAKDGIIEAIQNEDGTVLGIQWHPELMQMHGGIHTAIFKKFVELCAERMK